MDVETCPSRSSLSQGGRRDGGPLPRRGPPSASGGGSTNQEHVADPVGLSGHASPSRKWRELAPTPYPGVGGSRPSPISLHQRHFLVQRPFFTIPNIIMARANRFDSLGDPTRSWSVTSASRADFFRSRGPLPIICRPLLTARGPLLLARTLGSGLFSGKNTHMDHSLHK